MPADPRDERVEVACDAGEASVCVGTSRISRRAEQKNRGRNGGRYVCLPCSRRTKFAGRKNPNARHAIDDGFFEHIDDEGKAYLLGWIASDGSIKVGSIQLMIHAKDRGVVEQWLRILGAPLPVAKKGPRIGISINSIRAVADVCRWLGIVPGKKSATVGFPELPTEALTWAFLRGYFDGDGSVVAPTQARGPRCNITTSSGRFLDALVAFCPIKGSRSRDKVEWGGNNALDFLGKLYDGAEYRLTRKFDLYLDWCSWSPSLSGGRSHGREALFRWTRADPAAVPPSKSRVTDSGYDLTLLRKIKQHGLVEFFDTGIKVQPAFGWYFDVVARSSLSKTGYIMANAVGVIDRTYTGSIIVALMRVDPAAPPLELPARLAQMIPRPIVHAQLVEVSSLDETERGSGGFGSTGHHAAKVRAR